MAASGKRSRRLLAALPLLLVSLSLWAAPSASLRGRSMGTIWNLSWQQPDQPLASGEVRDRVQAALDRIDRQMSSWKADSTLSRFNRADAGTWHRLPADFWQVMARALALARATDGAYDPTVAPLVELWGFGAGKRKHSPPSAQAVAAELARVGWRQLQLDPLGRRLLQPGGVALDLSSVAKGQAIDQVARALAQLGIHDFLFELGGDLRVRGERPGGGDWRIALERPDAASVRVRQSDDVMETLALDHGAVVTSGDYRHRFRDAGASYSHHIDPRSGYPVQHGLASVTVRGETALYADPLGTAMMVLGPKQGLAFAEERGIAVLMVERTDRGFRQLASPAWRRLQTGQNATR